MNLPSDEDRDLRALFAQQRIADHEDAPAWRDSWLRAPAPAPRRFPLRWLPAALGIACLTLVLWLPSLKPKQTLSEALPPLFDAPSGELFADLGPSFTALESPSDFLLPDRLQSNLNFIHLP